MKLQRTEAWLGMPNSSTPTSQLYVTFPRTRMRLVCVCKKGGNVAKSAKRGRKGVAEANMVQKSVKKDVKKATNGKSRFFTNFKHNSPFLISHRFLSWYYAIKCNIQNVILLFARLKFFQESHETKTLKYPGVKIKQVVDVKLLIYVINSPYKKYWKFQVPDCSNIGTGVFSVFGHVTCPAHFKRADYNSLICARRLPRAKSARVPLRRVVLLYNI